MSTPFPPLRPCLAGLCASVALSAWAQADATPAADLEELEALLNKPVYAASKFAQDAADAPAAVTVLTAGDISAYGWRTIAEVLNGIRGVYLRHDRFYNYVGVRGFSRPGSFSSRLLVLIDGMRVNDNIYDQAGVGREFPLDVGLIERVEFIPGPGSALYGSNAVLGVVNIVTKSAAALRGGVVSVQFGSDSNRRLSFMHGREFGDASLVLAAEAEIRPGRDHFFADYDALATNFGVAAGADRETDRKLYAKWSQGGISVAGLLSQRRKQIPTGAFGTVFPSTDTFGTDRYGFAEFQWQHALDTSQQVTVRANLAQYDFLGSFDYGAPDAVQRLEQRGRWLGFEARWLYSGWSSQRVMLGLEAQHNLMQRQRSGWRGNDAGAMADLNDTSQRWGLFVNDELTLRAGLRAVLGARLDRQLNGDHAATPRIALLWDAAPGLVVKLLDGRAYREPNAYESKYEDTWAQANPSLRSESLRASELALDWRALPNLRVAASLYRYKVSDLIEQIEQVDPGDPSNTTLIYQNVGAVTGKGFELEADYVGANGWRARGSWAVQTARDADSTERISNSPRSLTKLNLSMPLPALQARAGIEWQHVGERLTVGTTSRLPRRLPGHSVTNLTLQVAPPGSRVSFSATLYNLFDTSYADPGGPEHLQDALPQDGRQWRLQLALQF